jgi:hypothetical protein
MLIKIFSKKSTFVLIMDFYNCQSFLYSILAIFIRLRSIITIRQNSHAHKDPEAKTFNRCKMNDDKSYKRMSFIYYTRSGPKNIQMIANLGYVMFIVIFSIRCTFALSIIILKTSKGSFIRF